MTEPTAGNAPAHGRTGTAVLMTVGVVAAVATIVLLTLVVSDASHPPRTPVAVATPHTTEREMVTAYNLIYPAERDAPDYLVVDLAKKLCLALEAGHTGVDLYYGDPNNLEYYGSRDTAMAAYRVLVSHQCPEYMGKVAG